MAEYMSIAELLDSNLDEMRGDISNITNVVNALMEEVANLKEQLKDVSERHMLESGKLLFGLPPREVLSMSDRRLYDRSINPLAPFKSYASMYYAKREKNCPFTSPDGKSSVIIIQDLYDWFTEGKNIGRRKRFSRIKYKTQLAAAI